MFEDSMLSKPEQEALLRAPREGAIPPKQTAILLLLALGVIYLLAAYQVGFAPFKSPAKRAAARAERATGLPAQSAADLVAIFRTSGLLVRDDGGMRYWVSVQLWARLDALQKERVCISLYTWRMAQGRQLPVQIYDAQSGGRLATYDAWSGFTVAPGI